MRRRKKSVNEFVNERLKGRIGALMDNRRRLLAPFPVPAERIYRAMWTPEERLAIRTLARHKEFMREGTNVTVRFAATLGEERKVVAVTARMRQSLPMPGFGITVPFENLELEHSDAIQAWVPKWMELKQEQNRMLVKLEQCGKVCKTFGQLYRLWPDILSFFSEDGAQTIRNAKVKSALPEGVLEYRGEDGSPYPVPRLKAMFSPEAFTPFTSMIAECLMLPEDNTTEVATVAVI